MHDVIVAIGRWHGGGMHLAPDASHDDGLFDVILIGDVNKLDFLTTAPRLYSGEVPVSLEGRPRARRERDDRRGRAAARRGRRRADRHDAGAVRGRSRRAARPCPARVTACSAGCGGRRSWRSPWLVAVGCAERGSTSGRRDHLMPLAGVDERRAADPPRVSRPALPLDLAFRPERALAQIVTLPGQVVISFVLVAVAAWKLRATVWIAAWFGVDGRRGRVPPGRHPSALYHDGVHIIGVRLVVAERARAAVRARRSRRSRRRGRGRGAARRVARRLGRAPRTRRLPHADRCGRRVAASSCCLWSCGAVGDAGAARALRKP